MSEVNSKLENMNQNINKIEDFHLESGGEVKNTLLKLNQHNRCDFCEKRFTYRDIM